MSSLTPEQLEKELKKRLDFPYRWGRKQSNEWDAKTNFIYKIPLFTNILERIVSFDQPLKDYALNRWYNFWSAKAVEHFFARHSIVKPNLNRYDKLVDFTIEEIPFDHKTSVFPRGFNRNFSYAKEHKKELIEWLYLNQSQQGRKHLKNRLFIVLFHPHGQHWKIKAEIRLLKKSVDNYIINFSKNSLEILDFGEGRVYSDIIWVCS